MDKIKEWILGLDFVREEIRLSNKAVYDLFYKPDQNIDELINERISLLLGTVDSRKIIKSDPKTGIVYMDDKMLDQATIQNYKQEAELMNQLGLWKAIEETVKASAQKRIFVDSKDMNDVLAGKMALYNLDLIKKILTVFLAK